MASTQMQQERNKAMETADSASKAQLSFQQLHVASRKISIAKIDQLARQLKLTNDDLDEINYGLQQHAVAVTGGEKKLQTLEAWKSKYPEKCTQENLLKALGELKLNKTADDINKELNESLHEKELLETDKRCHSVVPIVEDMAVEVANIVRGCYYKGLGFELGLSREQMDAIATECRQSNTLDNYVSKMLISWIQHDSSHAVLGKLYKALRILECNDMANQVFLKCAQIANVDEDSLR